MQKLKEHIYEFDEVVIGLTTSSLLYSYIFNLPILYKFKSSPRFFEFVDNSVNLTKTGLMKENKQLNFPKGKLVRSYSKKNVMAHLYMIQSLCGNIPFKDEISDLRVDEEEKILKITTHTQRVFKYKFNKLRIFDTRGLEFLVESGITSDKHYVLDEFEIKIKNDKFFHIIPKEGDFPRNIYISSDKKRLMAHSLLTPTEMNFPDFSSFFISKQVERELASHNIKAKLKYVKRYYEEKDPNEYEERDWYIIDKRNEEEVWKDRKINTYHTWLGSFRSRMVQRIMDTLGHTH
jgi:hypothetical protein